MTDMIPFGGGETPFDVIKRTDELGEYWSARDLMPIMGYGADWRNFADAIERAKRSAENAGHAAEGLFVDVTEKSGGRPRADYRLARYAAYLVAMNGDPRKDEVARAQTYFAVKTREAETAPTPRELSRKEMARYWFEAEERAELAERRAAELEPAAHSWEILADAEGDYSLRDAAQILNRDPLISTGQNRLSKYLKQIRWTDHTGRPYQAQVDLGRLAVRATTYPHPRTGEDVPTKQPRVTAKGLHELHKRLGGQGPLLLAA